ncbi:MAG: Rdx family protein [Deltaproteobacteria bacterium]|nr:Rdx family protein [Deltaproteobacteria bacterium]MBW2398701.1 Rdx family protein [Deltaproteobacteria bacterium]MBW2666010.1 Rdx family protein [Deltaproteobacteria bacterium]
MAAAIKAETGIEAELVRGGAGIFDVTVDAERIFSKKSVGRFPEAHEILDRLRG